MITPQQGYQIMLPRIESQSRHEYYDRTVNRRKLYHAMMTGEGLADMLVQFKAREDEEQLKARREIYQQCVTPAIQEVASMYNKTSRYPNIKKEIKYEKNPAKIIKLQKALEGFCYNGDVQSYLATEFDIRSLIDPNSFLVMDFGDYDALQNQTPGTYGVFIPCDNVVDYEYLPNDVLNYLIIERPISFYDPEGKVVNLKDYIGYLGDDIVVFEQQHEHREKTSREGGVLKDVGTSTYYSFAIQSKAGQVQAFRLGYIKDPITRYQTCVSPFDKAETVVIDLNNDKSEYDQTKRFHVFPQKYQFVQVCPGESNIYTCKAGCRPDGTTCKTCKGKGVLIHTSSSDVITLPMPRDAAEYIVPLSEMSHYAKPDIEIIKHLREDVEAGKRAIKAAIFTTESAKKTDGITQIAQTATAEVIKADDLNNTLLPFCEHKSKAFKFVVFQNAEFIDLADDLKVLFEFPESLRLETVEELQVKYSALVKAGASAVMLDALEREIIAKQYVDDPEGLKKYETWRKHRPFRNIPSEEVQFRIGSGSVPKWLEVLWANFEHILTELEADEPRFYDLDYKAQRVKIKETALTLQSELEPEPVTGFLGKTVNKESAEAA